MAAYRDLAARFADANAQVLGISTDDVATQKKFAASLKLPFPLLADGGGKVAGAYRVKSLGMANRVTFVVGTDGRIERIVEGGDALDPSSALAVCEAPAR